MRYIHHVHQDIGLAHLVESALEGIHKMRGQLADEAYGVGKQKRQIVDNHLAHRGVERCEQLVLGKHVAFAQQVHQSALAHVGVAHKSHTGELAAVFPLHGFLAVDGAQLLLEQGYLVENDASVGLDLSLAGTAHTYTAALALEVRPHAGEPRKQVLVLRQLHLRFRARRLGALGKDVENEIGAVENFHSKLALYVEHLLGGKVIVENGHGDVAIVVDEFPYFLELAFAHKSPRVGIVQALGEASHLLGAGSIGEEGEFVEVFGRPFFVLGGSDESHKYGALGSGAAGHCGV